MPNIVKSVIQELSTRPSVGVLAIFSPQPGRSQLGGLAQILEQLFPALKRCDLQSIPAAGWAAMVKAELSNHKKRTRLTCIVDELELLFDEQIPPSERISFLRIMSELAESPDISVLLVIDQAFLRFCRAIDFLEKSLDGPHHIRLPDSERPLEILPGGPQSPAPVCLARPKTSNELHRKSTSKRLPLNPSSLRRQIVFVTTAAAFASVSLILSFTFLGQRNSEVASSSEWSTYAGSGIQAPDVIAPSRNLTPVTGSKPIQRAFEAELKTRVWEPRPDLSR
tara:strand:+ start:18585 stop:19427 length:843 start_codon:yes stop_codon:yes gene_type:complete